MQLSKMMARGTGRVLISKVARAVTPNRPKAVRSHRTCKKNIILAMKLTTILLLSACLTVSAAGRSQTVTLNLKDVPIQKVFKEVIRHTGTSIIYNEAFFQKAARVTIKVKDAPVSSVLSQCLNGLPFTFDVEDNSIVIKKKPVGYNRIPQVIQELPLINVHGRVVNEKGEPVAGATVTVKGTRNATATDDNGEFVLKGVDENAVLMISGVNIETFETKVNGRTDLGTLKAKIKVSESEEVLVEVNTGFQQIPKERVTGSFTYLDNKTINQQVGLNIIDRLKGVASSVLFDKKNDGPSFSIRGLSTINGPKEPLIVLDNYPYEGDINNINPNDIDNITILKDAAAASIWGTRAGNGVVVITTKKGRFNQPLKIEFNTNYTVTQKPDLFSLPQMSSADYIEVEEMLFNNGFFDDQINSPYHAALTPAVEIFLKKQQGLISDQEATSQLNVLKAADTRNDYNKYLYRNAVNQQYALNLHGGSDNIAYLISGGYDRSISNLDAPYSRISLRSENMYRPVKGLQINFGLLYTNSKSESGKPGYGDITVGSRPVPYLSLADANGNPVAIAKTYRQSYTDTAGGGKLLDWNYYPLEDYKYNTGKTSLSDFLGKLGLNYRLMPGLDIDIKYQYQKQQTTGTTLAGVQSYNTRDLINQYTELDYTTGEVNYGFPLGGIFGKSISTLESQNIRGQINFNRKFGKHEITSLVGSEIRQNKINTDNLSAFGYDPDLLTTGIIDAGTPHLNFVTGSYDYLNPARVSFSAKNNRFVSFFGNASYIFREKYILNGSVRKDASNLFGKATNDKWTPLWSIGAGWNISREAFYKSTLLPELKLRATYGYSGNVDQSKSAVTVMFYSGNARYTNLPYGAVTQYKNSELRWERVGMFNIGLDFGFKNKIISGSLEYYRKKGVDLFGPSPIDYTAGLRYYTIIKNVANMKANGIDLSLASNNINTRTFHWATNFLLSYNLAKTDKYYLEPGISSGSFVNFGNSITPIPGQPLYTVISYQSGGLDEQGNPQGFFNKELSTDYYSIAYDTSRTNIVYSGTAVPKYFGSLINSFSWEGLTISVNISYKLGYFFRRPFLSYDQLFNYGIGHKEFADRWQQPGDELTTDVPAMVYPNDGQRDIFYGLSEATVEKGSHIRLQYINAAYNLPVRLMQKTPFRGLQLYANASNLGIIWRANKKGIDPDFPGSVPIQKSYSIGLRTNF